MSVNWGTPPRVRRCSRCGSDENGVNIGLRAIRTKGDGGKRTSASLASRSASFCEACAHDVFSVLADRLEDLTYPRST